MQYHSFSQYYDKMMHDVDYDGWADYIDMLIRKFDGGINVLDCACGTGNITVRLFDRGYSVIGSDLSEDMLFVAQTKARRLGMNIPFVCQDIRNISMHRPLDVINCSCDGVNYLLGDKDIKDFFSSANKALKPNGLLLLDISTEYKLESILGDRFMGEDQEDYSYLWQNSFDKQLRLLIMDLTFFVREGNSFKRFREQHVQYAHRQSDILDELGKCGFIVEAAFDAFKTERTNKESQRIQFVARKNNG